MNFDLHSYRVVVAIIMVQVLKVVVIRFQSKLHWILVGGPLLDAGNLKALIKAALAKLPLEIYYFLHLS